MRPLHGVTLQADALQLVAKKLQSSLAVEGELPEDGLAAYGDEGDDLMLALARKIVAGEAGEESVEDVFAQAQQVAAEAEALLVDDGWHAPESVAVEAEAVAVGVDVDGRRSGAPEPPAVAVLVGGVHGRGTGRARAPATERSSLQVTNAAIAAVSRVDERSDLWEVLLTPETDAMVTVFLSPSADCDAAGAVCTEDGRMLSFGVARVIPGPPPNSPATGQPSISGAAQVGQTLTADTSGIADEDGLDNVTFRYRWMADDANIQGATGSSYTIADRDEGKAIKVTVSITADATASTLDRIVAGRRTAPGYIRCDNGPELTANGRLRDEFLAVEQFDSLLEAQVLIEDWRIEYNTTRPHSSLGWLAPAAYAEQRRAE